MKLIAVKEWCNDNISVIAWQRITTKALPFFREKGFTYKDIESPTDDFLIDIDFVNVIIEITKQYYNIVIPFMEDFSAINQSEDPKKADIGANSIDNEQVTEIKEPIKIIPPALSMSQIDVDERNKSKTVSAELAQMTQSIIYASQIQKALLPNNAKILQHVAEYFCIYQPKDVVSGDLYWFLKEDNKLFFAAVDCTGHGVPGGFMSMMANTLLNNIVADSNVYSPALILDFLHEGIKSELHQVETGNTDGMDVCLICVEPQGNEFKVTFCGAKRPLIIFKDNEIIQLKGTRRSIGGVQMPKQAAFQNQVITLKKNDALYLTSDGFVDTPNENRDKFGLPRLQKMIYKYANTSMESQKRFFSEALEVFRQDSPQRDDILMMGIRL